MSIETLKESSGGLFGSASISDLLGQAKNIALALAGKLSSDAADLSGHMGEVHDVYWQPNGAYFPAELVKIEVELGLVMVRFTESASDHDRTFAVSPNNVKIRQESVRRVYGKS
ncbi:hypothetical protein [Ewingella americana]|uniref:Uncharacterized protein n=1 Tax=Ewingella americana TaxID=41202 RepID=A0A502GGI8_9GAMM|nr:hypothetical protein [Ewingella americana]TPG60076.1 hypothetical protein EAH77_16035 [Ewingella americana]